MCASRRWQGQVARFLHDHLGNPFPSMALIEPIGDRLRREVHRFAEREISRLSAEEA